MRPGRRCTSQMRGFVFGPKGVAICSLAIALAMACGSARAAGPRDAMPAELEGVGVDEHLGVQVPLDLIFRDASGESVTLGSLLKDGRPAIVTLNYSDCPMLCSLQLNGFVDGLRTLKWAVGREFDVITVSLDPTEGVERAAQTRDRYLKQYGRAVAREGWHFLVGSESNIQTLADTVGFKYKYIEDTGDYVHAPALIVLTPTGIVSRYLYGVSYEQDTLKMSLVEAAAGRLGSPLDQILMYCFQYDAEKGRYAPVARNVMRLGGALTVMVLGFVLGGVWIRDRRKNPRTPLK